MAPLISPVTGAAGIGTRGARRGVVILWVCAVASAILIGQVRVFDVLWWMSVAAAVLCLVAAFLVTQQSNDLLARPRAAAVAAAIAAAATLGIAASQGHATWVVGFSAAMGALLLMRGNTVWGAASLVAAAPPPVVAGIVQGLAPHEVLKLISTPLVLAPLAAAWRWGLLSLVRRERAHRTAQARSALAAEASVLATQEYIRQFERIRTDATPILQRIATAPQLDRDDLTELEVIEGGIRDRMRSPLARDDRLTAAIADARRRGVRVHLLWEGDSTGALAPALVDAVVGMVRGASGGSLVIRGDASREEMSVVHNEEGAARRTVLDDVGHTRSVT